MIDNILMLESLKLLKQLDKKDSELANNFRNKIMINITNVFNDINNEIKELLKDNNNEKN